MDDKKSPDWVVKANKFMTWKVTAALCFLITLINLIPILLNSNNQQVISSGSDGSQKIAFSIFCKQLEPISKISSILGSDRIDTVCTCGYSETLKSVSQGEMKKAMSTGAGAIDPEVVKVAHASQFAIASCLKNLDVPENAKELTSRFAEVLKAQAEMQKLMSK